MTQKLIVILGPTAAGKTDLAIKLAKKFNGEIVSADSRQIFKGMDIGTAKPNLKKGCFKGIRHYLIDVFDLDKELSAALFKGLAIKTIKKILKKGKLPFLVGGTGLYIKAVIDNLDFPKIVPNKDLRRKLEKKSLKELFRLYQKLDPEGAKIIDKDNKRRLVRALEVCYLSKQPFWQQRKQKKPLFEVLQIGIKLPKPVLDKNISIRTDKMMRLGLEREIRTLLGKHGNLLIFSQTIGYQEWLPFLKSRIDSQTRKKIAEEISKLDSDEISKLVSDEISKLVSDEISKLDSDEISKHVSDKIKNHTRQYAKRQLVWFKKDKRIKWISPPDLPKKAEKLLKNFLNQK